MRDWIKIIGDVEDRVLAVEESFEQQKPLETVVNIIRYERIKKSISDRSIAFTFENRVEDVRKQVRHKYVNRIILSCLAYYFRP